MSTNIVVYRTVGLHEGGSKYYRAYLVSIQKQTKYTPPHPQYVVVRNWGADTGGSTHAEERDHGQSAVEAGKSKYASILSSKRKRGYSFWEEQTVASGVVTSESSAIALLGPFFKPSTITEIQTLMDGFIGQARGETEDTLDESVAEKLEAKRFRQEKEAQEQARLNAARSQHPLWGLW